MNKHTLKRAGLQFYDPEDFYAKEVTLRRGRETKVWIHKPSGHGLLDPENWVSDSYYEEEYREQFSAESNGQKNYSLHISHGHNWNYNWRFALPKRNEQ